MACSNCGAAGHRIQTCPTVRRCGHCHRPGHDRRNCPRLTSPPAAIAPVEHPPREPPQPTTLSPDDPLWQTISRLGELCAEGTNVLAHVYWPRREHFFDESRRRHEHGGAWRLKATPGHGVEAPFRPTLNFFVVNADWLNAYKLAAASRGLRHGLLVHRLDMEALGRRPGCEFAEVRVGHPRGFGVGTRSEFWKYDIGNHRYKALHALRFSTVVRLATPEGDEAQILDVPHDAIITWW